MRRLLDVAWRKKSRQDVDSLTLVRGCQSSRRATCLTRSLSQWRKDRMRTLLGPVSSFGLTNSLSCPGFLEEIAGKPQTGRLRRSSKRGEIQQGQRAASQAQAEHRQDEALESARPHRTIGHVSLAEHASAATIRVVATRRRVPFRCRSAITPVKSRPRKEQERRTPQGSSHPTGAATSAYLYRRFWASGRQSTTWNRQARPRHAVSWRRYSKAGRYQ